jgi:BirA family biotin operon repressor/biotin-[acetyl-CoA-carboxylase] ligase
LQGRFGRPVRVLPTTGSTNTDALEWAEDGAPEGALVIAEHQTAGRGRWARSWFSEPGAGLMFSLILRPRPDAGNDGLLTTALGVACAEALEATTGLSPSMKWPNDITLEGRKLAGILVETRVEGGRIRFAVAGIGINYHHFEPPEEIAARTTSVADAMRRAGLGTVPPRRNVLAALLRRFEDLYGELTEDGGDIVDRASARSEILGKDVRVSFADGTSIEGSALRLTLSGGLEILSSGHRTVLDSGEVERIRPR